MSGVVDFSFTGSNRSSPNSTPSILRLNNVVVKYQPEVRVYSLHRAYRSRPYASPPSSQDPVRCTQLRLRHAQPPIRHAPWSRPYLLPAQLDVNVNALPSPTALFASNADTCQMDTYGATSMKEEDRVAVLVLVLGLDLDLELEMLLMDERGGREPRTADMPTVGEGVILHVFRFNLALNSFSVNSTEPSIPRLRYRKHNKGHNMVDQPDEWGMEVGSWRLEEGERTREEAEVALVLVPRHSNFAIRTPLLTLRADHLVAHANANAASRQSGSNPSIYNPSQPHTRSHSTRFHASVHAYLAGHPSVDDPWSSTSSPCQHFSSFSSFGCNSSKIRTAPCQ
ncbi:hypothetical protein CVT26_014300 [Gymnopilus dilepis]|uniref:Uncharacterized protein n=1 Tax=Gymnopilus dilepis TaxID=231916 RepID=A0A409Y8E5_9AGAR|nr:hypothetical protein CVT26_014300 [Gymnopilus dilepis]